MRSGALSKQRATTPTFLNQTNFARPTSLAEASRQVPFTTKTELDAAISGMAAGDYIYYNGTGVLTISTTTAVNAYTITGKNPSGLVTIDFGAARSYWGSPTSGDYVKFVQNHTSAAGFSALLVSASSNLAIYGGEYTSTSIGVSLRGSLTNSYLLDAWVHDVAGSGVWFIPGTTSGSVATISGCTVRAEVGPNWCMNPALDPHGDKGTGQHCCLAADASNGSNFTGNTVVIYGHDSLQPGAVSYGKTWPEGGGGSVIEFGQSISANLSNNTLYALGVNNKQIPNGTNPGSTQQQTAGNVINLWGTVPLTGLTIPWVESSNITGSNINGNANAGWHSVPISVVHGRHANCNLSTVGSNISIPYDNRWGVTYGVDCI